MHLFSLICICNNLNWIHGMNLVMSVKFKPNYAYLWNGLVIQLHVWHPTSATFLDFNTTPTCATCVDFHCQYIYLVFHYIENPSSPAPPSFAPSTGFSPAPSLSEDSTEFKKPNTTSGGTRRFYFLSYLREIYCYLWKLQRYQSCSVFFIWKL